MRESQKVKCIHFHTADNFTLVESFLQSDYIRQISFITTYPCGKKNIVFYSVMPLKSLTSFPPNHRAYLPSDSALQCDPRFPLHLATLLTNLPQFSIKHVNMETPTVNTGLLRVKTERCGQVVPPGGGGATLYVEMRSWVSQVL